MLTRSLLTLSGVERGLHGHPDLSTAMQPHTHKKIPSTMHSHTFLSKPALTSAIWAPAAHPSDQTAQANFSFPHASVSLTYPWPCRRYSAVSSSDNLWCILTTHCRLDAPHKSCSFRDALTQLSSHHSRPLSNLVISLHLPIFFVSITSNSWDKMFTCCLIYPIRLEFYSLHLSAVINLCLIIVYLPLLCYLTIGSRFLMNMLL